MLDILPEGEGPLHIVLENTCGEAYTYELFGSDAAYIGDEDYHDAIFDDMEVKANISSFTDSADTEFSRGNGDLDGTCSYRLRIYPTERVKFKYITWAPILYALGITLIFVFTSTVFLAYDVLIRRRQRKVIQAALAHGSIVSSLFPKRIREQMLNAPTNSDDRRRGTIKDYIEESRSLSVNTPPPIAEQFDHCTVLFTDIAVGIQSVRRCLCTNTGI